MKKIHFFLGGGEDAKVTLEVTLIQYFYCNFKEQKSLGYPMVKFQTFKILKTFRKSPHFQESKKITIFELWILAVIVYTSYFYSI